MCHVKKRIVTELEAQLIDVATGAPLPPGVGEFEGQTGYASEANNWGAPPGHQSCLAQCPCCKNFVMREIVEEFNKENPCQVYADPCPTHGFIHGAEAEELREGLERILKEAEDPTYDVSLAIELLLDKVDARDSVAYLEHRLDGESEGG